MGKIYNNLISTTAGFNYPAQQPLDDRTVVKSYSDLMILVDSNMTYDGIEVYVVDDEKSYKLINSEWKAIATEDYVSEKIADTPINEGEGDYTSQTGYGTQAVGHYTSASGYNTIAGIKGYFFQNIEFGPEIFNEDGISTKTYGPCNITLTKEQPDDIKLAPVPEPFKIGFSVGDELTITNNSKYPRCCRITAIENNVITVDTLPFNSIKNKAGDIGVDEYQVICSDKPQCGEVSLGYYAHAEGETTRAIERASHAEGRETVAEGQYSHAEGRGSISRAYTSHAEGFKTISSGEYSHAEGSATKASGYISHAEGSLTEAVGEYSHAEGFKTISSGECSHAEGNATKASGYISHAEGSSTEAVGEYSHAEGFKSTVSGHCSHAEGLETKAIGYVSHAEGAKCQAIGGYSHAEGSKTIAQGNYSHAEGESSQALGSNSHAEGYSTIANGFYSHAEGRESISKAYTSHAEGFKTISSGECSHAEGNATKASGYISHAEGGSTEAVGEYSHAEGYSTIANGFYSHTEGKGTITTSDCSHVQGKWNIEDTAKKYAHIVGNGSSSSKRSNAHTVDWNGNAWFAGNITVGKNNSIVLTNNDILTETWSFTLEDGTIINKVVCLK